MARCTRSFVSGVTLSEPLIVRETVAVETRARRATSLMFIGNFGTTVIVDPRGGGNSDAVRARLCAAGQRVRSPAGCGFRLDPFAFDYGEDAVDRGQADLLQPTVGPVDLDGVHAGGVAESEVDAGIVGREV